MPWQSSRYGLQVVTLRLYSVYSPWEEPARLLPRLVIAGLGKWLPQLIAPETGRDFVWIHDVVDAYMRAAAPGAPPGSVYRRHRGTADAS